MQQYHQPKKQNQIKKAKNVNVVGTENLIKEINKNKKNMWFFFQVPHMFMIFPKNQLKKILEKNQLVIMEKLNFVQKER